MTKVTQMTVMPVVLMVVDSVRSIFEAAYSWCTRFAEVLSSCPNRVATIVPNSFVRNQPRHRNDPTSSLTKTSMTCIFPLQIDQLAAVVPDLNDCNGIVVRCP